MSRFVVTEIEGYLVPATSGMSREGLSCMVIDTAFNRRVVRTFRTEDYIGGKKHEARRADVRRIAAEHAARFEVECA